MEILKYKMLGCTGSISYVGVDKMQHTFSCSLRHKQSKSDEGKVRLGQSPLVTNTRWLDASHITIGKGIEKLALHI